MKRSLVSGLVVSIVLVSASLAQTPDQGPPPDPAAVVSARRPIIG